MQDIDAVNGRNRTSVLERLGVLLVQATGPQSSRPLLPMVVVGAHWTPRNPRIPAASRACHSPADAARHNFSDLSWPQCYSGRIRVCFRASRPDARVAQSSPLS
jgi:hypothetical protein